MTPITFIPFAGKNETGLRGKKTKIELFDTHIKMSDCYTVDVLKDEEDEALGTKELFVDAILTLRKSSIDRLYYMLDNDEDGYFIHINGNCWGFKNKEEGQGIFNQIYDWLYNTPNQLSLA